MDPQLNLYIACSVSWLLQIRFKSFLPNLLLLLLIIRTHLKQTIHRPYKIYERKSYGANYKVPVRFQVLTAASMKIRAFWDVAPCSLVGVDRRFRGAYCLHHQGEIDECSTHLWNVRSTPTSLHCATCQKALIFYISSWLYMSVSPSVCPPINNFGTNFFSRYSYYACSLYGGEKSFSNTVRNICVSSKCRESRRFSSVQNFLLIIKWMLLTFSLQGCSKTWE
jgi:hypothetical protein